MTTEDNESRVHVRIVRRLRTYQLLLIAGYPKCVDSPGLEQNFLRLGPVIVLADRKCRQTFSRISRRSALVRHNSQGNIGIMTVALNRDESSL